MRKRKNLIVILMVLSVSLAGCNSKTSNSVSGSSSANTSEVSTMDTSDMFSDRDMKTGYDEATSAAITLSDNGSSKMCIRDSCNVVFLPVYIGRQRIYGPCCLYHG